MATNKANTAKKDPAISAPLPLIEVIFLIAITRTVSANTTAVIPADNARTACVAPLLFASFFANAVMNPRMIRRPPAIAATTPRFSLNEIFAIFVIPIMAAIRAIIAPITPITTKISALTDPSLIFLAIVATAISITESPANIAPNIPKYFPKFVQDPIEEINFKTSETVATSPTIAYNAMITFFIEEASDGFILCEYSERATNIPDITPNIIPNIAPVLPNILQSLPNEF